MNIMKKSKEINDINIELFSSLDNIDETINTVRDQVSEYYKKIKKEFTKIVIEEKYQLISKIAQGENLDINTLKTKYLKAKDLVELNETIHKKYENNNEELLDRIEYNGVIYYFENKEKGLVFDVDNKEVGIYKNKLIILHECI